MKPKVQPSRNYHRPGRHIRLNMHHSPHTRQHLHRLRLRLRRLPLSEPAYKAHRRFRPVNTERVLQRDGKPMQRSNWLAVSGNVGIKFAGPPQGGIKEDLAEAVDLYKGKTPPQLSR